MRERSRRRRDPIAPDAPAGATDLWSVSVPVNRSADLTRPAAVADALARTDPARAPGHG